MLRFASITRAATARLAHLRRTHGVPVSWPSASRPALLGDLSNAFLLAVVAIGFLTPTMVRSEPIVTGCQVLTYATVPNPQSLAPAPDGTIYAGHDSHQGDTHADPVFRIAAGGAPVTEYGNQSFYDPDGVLYDPDGSATGIAGGILVSDWVASSESSALRLIHPDESVTTWAASGQAIKNPTYLVMDATGAVWLTDDYRYQTGLLRVIAGTAHVMVSGPPYGFSGIAISPAGTLFVAANTDGTNKTVREYDLNGNLLQANFATSASFDLLAFGPGGAFGTDLWAMSLHGDLYRLDSNGNAIQVGSGFQQPVDLKFGSDGNLYVSEDTEGRILQVTPAPSAASPWAAAPLSGSSSVSVFPNPSQGCTDIRLALGSTQPEIGVAVFDVAGRLIRELHSGPLTTGAHTIPWNGLDAIGRRCANGIYYVRVQAPGTQLQTRIVRAD
jgi:sugar lactone lactonase YvrE